MYRLFRPLLFRLDAETAHRLAIRSAKLIQKTPALGLSTTTKALAQDIWGLHFANPVGIAAGLDKNGECIPYWARIGAGFAEIGSVSAEPAPGNPQPRAFRLPQDRALINRMGLNNDGAKTIVPRLPAGIRRHAPLGINIVKTNRDDLSGQAALDDFCTCFRLVSPAADYVTLNVSCPNTAEGKTFEEPDALDALLAAIEATGTEMGTSRKPLLVKLSPPAEKGLDEGRYSEILSVVLARRVDGIVAANTASDREGLSSDPARIRDIGPGGLSGRPVADRSTRLVRFLFRESGGTLPIIGVGGVDSTEAALRKILAGASLIQLYTGLVYEGPGLVNRIVKGLARYVQKEGKALSSLVGTET